MPVYVQCPHCEHPTVLRNAVEGRPYRCRQCNEYYVVQLAGQREEPPRELSGRQESTLQPSA